MGTIRDNLTILAVEDLEISRRFYMDQMGFEEYLRTGGWSFLKRGSLRLRVGHCPGIVPISKCQAHSLIVQAVVDDVDALHAEFEAKGVDVSAPEDKPWGQREFGVLTPDGHRFMFSQSLEGRHLDIE